MTIYIPAEKLGHVIGRLDFDYIAPDGQEWRPTHFGTITDDRLTLLNTESPAIFRVGLYGLTGWLAVIDDKTEEEIRTYMTTYNIPTVTEFIRTGGFFNPAHLEEHFSIR